MAVQDNVVVIDATTAQSKVQLAADTNPLAICAIALKQRTDPGANSGYDTLWTDSSDILHFRRNAGDVALLQSSGAELNYAIVPIGNGLTTSGSDVVADFGSTNITTIQPDDSASYGTNTDLSRTDHQHAIVCAAAGAITDSAAEGSSTSFARSDHDHTYGADSIDNLAIDWGSAGNEVDANDVPLSATVQGASDVQAALAALEALATTGISWGLVHFWSAAGDVFIDGATGVGGVRATARLTFGVPANNETILVQSGKTMTAKTSGADPTVGEFNIGSAAVTAANFVSSYNNATWGLSSTAEVSSEDSTIVNIRDDAINGADFTFTNGLTNVVVNRDREGGQAYSDVVDGEAHTNSENNTAYIADIVAASITWIEFIASTPGDITAVVAGAGLTGGATSGSATLDVGAGTGISVSANAVAIDLTSNLSITGDWNFSSGTVGLPQSATTTEGDIWYVTTGDRVAFYAAASVKTLWDDTALAVSSAQYSVMVADSSAGWVEDTGFKVTSGAVTTGSWTATAVASGYGGTGIDTSGSTGVPYVSSGTWATETALDETRGGTGQTSYTTGDILYASASNTLSKLAAGSNGYVLTMGASVPAWVTPGAPGAHASTHSENQSDEVLVENLGTATLTASYFVVADGSGGLSMQLGDLPPQSSTQYSVLVADASNGWVEDAGFRINAGDVTQGDWKATAVASGYGGTGIDTSGSSGVPWINAGTWAVMAGLSEVLGGTGQDEYLQGDTLYSDGTDSLAVLAKGSSYQTYRMNSGATVPEWGAAMPIGGGTGLTSYTAGDILYASASNVLSKLAKGNDGDVLTLASGVPSWSDAAAEGEVLDLTSDGSGVTVNLFLYLSAAGVVTHATNASDAGSNAIGVADATVGAAAAVTVTTSGLHNVVVAAGASAVSVGEVLFLKTAGQVTTADDLTIGTDYIVPACIANATLSSGGGTVAALLGAGCTAAFAKTAP